MRRGVVGALASGDARVRRACGAVRKGARAEAGWCRAPHARAEGFMGVRLRTFFTDYCIVIRVGARGCGSVFSANVTFLSIIDLRPRPLARPGQSQLADR